MAALLSAGTFAYLLRAFPYNGLYGVDSYAYAGQSDALLQELQGRPPRAGALFTTAGFAHWPVGYHLILIVGRLLDGGSVAGGRFITLALAALVPVLTYLLVVRLATFLSPLTRSVAGVIAAGSLLITATFIRTGTSLMSDVPAMFWWLLACVIVAWRWPPEGDRVPGGPPWMWGAVAGASLGLAVLIRYPSALVAVPIVVYLILRWRSPSRTQAAARPPRREALLSAIAALLAFALMLAPEAAFLLTHDLGSEAGTYFSNVSIRNILSRSSTGPDGNEAYSHTMLEFYLISPVADATGGFLPLVFAPLVLTGALALFVRRRWDVAVMLLTWWILPALLFAATPYQTHRFALLYLPAIAMLAGLGVGYVLDTALSDWRVRPRREMLPYAVLTVAVAALLVFGAAQGFLSVRSWQATHAAWQAADEALSKAVLAAAGPGGRAVCLPSCPPVDFYTRLPILDMYNNDEETLGEFIRPGSTAAAVVERSLSTQWAGTPVGQRWAWLSMQYDLRPAGTSGDYRIYRVTPRSQALRRPNTMK